MQKERDEQDLTCEAAQTMCASATNPRLSSSFIRHLLFQSGNVRSAVAISPGQKNQSQWFFKKRKKKAQHKAVVVYTQHTSPV